VRGDEVLKARLVAMVLRRHCGCGADDGVETNVEILVRGAATLFNGLKYTEKDESNLLLGTVRFDMFADVEVSKSQF
jgi:hypothetical protein